MLIEIHIPTNLIYSFPELIVILALTKCDVKFPDLAGDKMRDLYTHAGLRKIINDASLKCGIDQANIFPCINVSTTSRLRLEMQIASLTMMKRALANAESFYDRLANAHQGQLSGAGGRTSMVVIA